MDSLRAASALCFAADTSPACPLNHSHFLPLAPPPSQVILIKSVSLAWQAKIIGEGFWMPFTLNSARFFPFSCFSSTPTASAITPPLPPLISRHAVTYLPFPSYFLSVQRTSKCGIWINACASEGTAPCELQILADAAIFWKWQIRQSNLSNSLCEATCFEKVFVLAPL